MIMQSYRALYLKYKPVVLIAHPLVAMWFFAAIAQLFAGEPNWWRVCSWVTMFVMWFLVLMHTVFKLVDHTMGDDK